MERSSTAHIHVAACCRLLQYVTDPQYCIHGERGRSSTAHIHVAVRCSVLQAVAVCCVWGSLMRNPLTNFFFQTKKIVCVFAYEKSCGSLCLRVPQDSHTIFLGGERSKKLARESLGEISLSVCVCVCVSMVLSLDHFLSLTHTHTLSLSRSLPHTHTYTQSPQKIFPRYWAALSLSLSVSFFLSLFLPFSLSRSLSRSFCLSLCLFLSLSLARSLSRSLSRAISHPERFFTSAGLNEFLVYYSHFTLLLSLDYSYLKRFFTSAGQDEFLTL